MVDATAVFKPDLTMLDSPQLGQEAAVAEIEPADGEEQPVDTVADGPKTDASTDEDALPETASPDDTADAGAKEVSPTDAAGDVSASCGNGKCADGENCQTCPADCGTCPAFCGNGTCAANETCASCPQDCGACPAPTCKVLTSAGCASGKQCFPDGKSNLCYSAGSLKPGDPCKNFNDCVIGALCVAGLCRQLCDWTGKDATQLCKPGVPCDKLVFDGAGEAGQNLGACKPSAPCNPLTDAGCASGSTCTPSGWLKTCIVAGTSGLGSACSQQSACGLGLLCINDGKGLQCLARCHTDGQAPVCAAGTCSPVLGPDAKSVPDFVGFCK
ncbi:MAG: hypothetical protein EXR77_04120 [Myxococcales bacterium]|nr:hypothetical protein [Myxococcales bacterium]